MRTPLAVATLLALAAPAAIANADAGQTPLGQMKQQNDKLQKILRRKVVAGSPDEQKAKDDLKGIVNDLIDYGELAERSLGAHWAKLSKPQQAEFTTTLRDLIEQNYVKQLHTNLDYEVIYKDEQTSGDEATVQTLVKARTKGKSTEIAIDYKLKRSRVGGNSRWVVYDVVTDEVSLVKNYRAQFNKIITAESYDGLLQKMRKKIQDVEKS